MAGIALVFNLALNLLLIPLYQQVGAALVTSLTELLLMIVSLILIPRSLWPLGSTKVGLKALLAGLVMGVAVWFMQHSSILAILPVAALVYFSVATLLGTIPRDDVRALYTSIRYKAGHTTVGVEQETAAYERFAIITEIEDDNDTTIILKAIRPTKEKKTRDLPWVEDDDDATVVLKAVHPTKRGKQVT